jgi:hypothetical protein
MAVFAGACGVVNKRSITDGRVSGTFCVAKKGLIAVGRVKAARFPARPVGVVGRPGIAKEREFSSPLVRKSVLAPTAVLKLPVV